MIDIDGLSVALGGTPILRDIDLRFGRGGITALVGPNGAGKSTFLHAVGGPGPGSRSVVIVLHDLNAAARYADRVVALKAGRQVTSGPAALALTGRMLSAIFATGLAVETVRGRRLVAPV